MYDPAIMFERWVRRADGRYDVERSADCRWWMHVRIDNAAPPMRVVRLVGGAVPNSKETGANE